MKKLVILCVLFFSAVIFAQAQQGGNRMGGTPEERVKRNVTQLVEKLKLTDDQKAKAEVIFTAQIADQQKLRDEMQGGGDRQAMMEKMQKMNTEVDTKISSFLTEEQKVIYKAWREEQRVAREKAMKDRQSGANQ